MIGKDRRDRLIEIIKYEKKVTVADLSQRFMVTEETIRQDLEHLELAGMLTRTRGGAVLKTEKLIDRLGYINRSQMNVEEKLVIARLVAKLIPDGATIFADASTTVMEALKLLDHRSDLTVLTNSVTVLSVLNQSRLNIMSTGGTNNPLSCSLQGVIARNTIMNYHVDYALTSCKGMWLQEGLYDSREGETEVKQLMIGRGQKVILLVDHTKFDHMSFVKYCNFYQIDVLVTDEKPSDEWVEMLAENQVQLLYPGGLKVVL